MKKLVILVIANRDPIYDQIVQIYWKKLIQYANKFNQIKIFLLYGNENIEFLDDIKDNIIKYHEKESYIPGILKKTIYGFEYIDQNCPYDYILRTNISSFFIYDRLVSLITTFKEEQFFSGPVGGGHTVINNQYIKFDFVSGSAIYLSKDLVKDLIFNKGKLEYNYIDDIAISRYFINLQKTNQNRYDIVNIKKKYDINLKLILKKINENNHYHIRVKTLDRAVYDIMIFNYLVEKFYNIN